MGILKRLGKRTRREQEEALHRLNEQSEHGPDAFQRFREVTRRLLAVQTNKANKQHK